VSGPAPDLAEAVAKAVHAVAPVHVRSVADAYGSVGTYSAGAAHRVANAVPATQRGGVQRINMAWASKPDIPGSAIALALRGALSARDRAVRDHPIVEVAVTGPDTPAVPVRLTSQVVLDLIAGATKRITIVSFAAYEVPSVLAALVAAKAHGVAVSLILESPENLKGGGGAASYAQFDAFRWPTEKRPTGALLHAKALIVDRRDVLLTSANLTNNAYDNNLEIGLLCRGGQVGAQVQDHFDKLIAAGVLVPVG
jgi:phosphatidylserine/phosphatidylglycerophosphate/cardiolipin synthase-like enzyme